MIKHCCFCSFMVILSTCWGLISAAEVSVPTNNYSGSVSSTTAGGAGITGFANWGSLTNGSSVSWTITQGNQYSPASFHYVYSITVPDQNIKDFILQTTSTFTASGIKSPTFTGTTSVANFPSSTYTGMPASIYGIQFAPTASSTTMSADFWSNNAPIWGDFFMTDDHSGGKDRYAYNAGYTSTPTQINYNLYIPTLGSTVIIPAPEPGLMVLLGTALGTAAFRRYRSKQAMST